MHGLGVGNVPVSIPMVCMSGPKPAIMMLLVTVGKDEVISSKGPANCRFFSLVSGMNLQDFCFLFFMNFIQIMGWIVLRLRI